MIDRESFKEVFDATDEELDRFLELASPEEEEDEVNTESKNRLTAD